MSSRAHVSAPLSWGVGGAKPPGAAGGFGGAQPSPPIRNNNDIFKVIEYNSLLGHKIFRNNLGGSCANLATFRGFSFSYK